MLSHVFLFASRPEHSRRQTDIDLMDAVTSLTLKTGAFVQVYVPAALQTQQTASEL